MPALITNNLLLKIAALAISLVTWTGIVYATNPPEVRAVSVRLPQGTSDLAPEYVRVEPVADISVLVSGTRDHVNAFDPSSLHASISYKHINHRGVQHVPLQVTNTDGTVHVQSVPATIQVDIDTLQTSQVPVELVVVNPPPQGYITTSTTVTPNQIRVTGPSSELSGMRAKVNLDLSTDKTNLEADLPVTLTDASGRAVNNVGASQTIVRVQATVSTTATSRSSAVVPRTTGTVANGYQLTGVVVSPSTVTLSGPRDTLNSLDSVITDSINLNGLTAGETVTVSIKPPAGVSASPNSVSVTLAVTRIPPPPTPTPTPAPTP